MADKSSGAGHAGAGRGGAVTIAGVADEAGVSRATVSRVMNGRSTVDPEIAKRVQAAAARLNYRPSNVARSLSLGRTNSIALLVPDLGNPMFQQILRGVTNAAAEEGYRVLVADSGESPDDEAEIALEARLRCDALVLVSPRMSQQALTALLPQVSPAVVINRTAPDDSVSSILVDYVHGIDSVMEHLVSLGHSSLVYLAGPPSSASNSRRLAGLREALTTHPSLHVTEIVCGPTVSDGYAAAEAVLESRATAVVAFNDLVAFGLLARLNETGVAVPEDISVVGFDDIELARYATPSLTTVAVPQVELGRLAWERLREVITDPSAARRTIQVEPRLEIRASTGPVPVPGWTRAAVAARKHVQPPSRSSDGPAELVWQQDGETFVLEGTDLPLARYSSGHRMATVHAPRPHLHPVYSLTGAPMTEASPVDHRHHHGMSVAVPDVNGTSYWGGRTFVRGVGPTLLKNHGRQVGGGGETSDVAEQHGTLMDSVEWIDASGKPQLDEKRSITGLLLPEHDAWTLRWSSTLKATHDDLLITSPALTGRPEAGYGGLFWRLAVADETVVFSEAGPDEPSSHWSRSSWVAYAQRRGAAWTTLVLTQPGPPRPWFVRAATFPGAGPSLAWDAPLHIAAGEEITIALDAVIVDRRLGSSEAAALAALTSPGTIHG